MARRDTFQLLGDLTRYERDSTLSELSEAERAVRAAERDAARARERRDQAERRIGSVVRDERHRLQGGVATAGDLALGATWERRMAGVLDAHRSRERSLTDTLGRARDHATELRQRVETATERQKAVDGRAAAERRAARERRDDVEVGEGAHARVRGSSRL